MLQNAGERFHAETTAGLKAIQIASILAPPPPSEEERAEKARRTREQLAEGEDRGARERRVGVLL